MKVIDASAMIAYLFGEPGGDVAFQSFSDAAMSVVNVAEVLTRFARDGVDPEATFASVERCGVAIAGTTSEDAIEAARFPANSGLSLGDRLCIALAKRLNAPVVTADQLWATAGVGVSVELIR